MSYEGGELCESLGSSTLKIRHVVCKKVLYGSRIVIQSMKKPSVGLNFKWIKPYTGWKVSQLFMIIYYKNILFFNSFLGYKYDVIL